MWFNDASIRSMKEAGTVMVFLVSSSINSLRAITYNTETELNPYVHLYKRSLYSYSYRHWQRYTYKTAFKSLYLIDLPACKSETVP